MKFVFKLILLILFVQGYGYSSSRISHFLREEGQIITRGLSTSIRTTPRSITVQMFTQDFVSKTSMRPVLSLRYFSDTKVTLTKVNLLPGKSSAYPILDKINDEIKKLPSHLSVKEIANLLVNFIESESMDKDLICHAVANNCAVQLSISKDPVLEYCSELYRNNYMHPNIPPKARSDEGYQIREMIRNYEALPLQFKSEAIKLYLSTLLK